MKPSLLLFHGALGSSKQLESFAYELREDFNCIPFDFSGHGGKNFEQEFDIFQFANEIYEICKKRKTKPFAFGYSMGGYATLLAEHTFKNMFKGIITLGTKFDWNPQVAISEKVMLNPELIEKNFPAYANTLIERHKPNNWKNVLEKTSDLIHHLGENAPLNESTLKEIKTPVLVLRGEFDNMVSRAESTAAKSFLPISHYSEVLNGGHSFEKTNKAILKELIISFCNNY